jgi:hypothetical protein
MAEGTFWLLVTLEFKSVEDRDVFLREWTPVAAHCRSSEPGTLSYEAGVSDKNPLQVGVLVCARMCDERVSSALKSRVRACVYVCVCVCARMRVRVRAVRECAACVCVRRLQAGALGLLAWL